MKRLSHAVMVLALSALLFACAGPVTSMLTNRENLIKLKPGMAQSEVEEIMGKPDFKDMMTTPNFERTTLWYFSNEMGNRGFSGAIARATVTRDDCTPLMFKDGKLYMSGDFARKMY
jgi:outer membrane protein assembly factor BamE (lipoprotein component of BamABCDE complex)